jgi:hypothetical protein
MKVMEQDNSLSYGSMKEEIKHSHTSSEENLAMTCEGTIQNTTSNLEGDPGQSTEPGEQTGTKIKLRLIDLKLYQLGEQGPSARQATHEEFQVYGASIVEVNGDVTWTVIERRDFLNWCLDQGLIEVDTNFFRIKKFDKNTESSMV